MKQENINYFSVGLFVIGTFVVFLFGLYSITGQGTDSDEYYVEFKNVAGIRTGSPVTYAGFEIGQLVDIEPVRNSGRTHYKLELQVKSGWSIPSDSVAQIVTPSLLSEKQIDIKEGKSSTFLNIGETLAGEEATDVFAMVEQISQDFQKLSNEGLKPILNTLNDKIAGSLPVLVDQTSTLLTNLNNSATELNTLLKTVDQKRVDSILDNAEKMAEELLSVSNKLDKAATQVEAMMANTGDMMEENNKDLRKALLDLRTSMGVIEENMNSIMYNIDTSSRNLNEFSRQIRDNPAVLLNGKPPQDAIKNQ